MLIDTFDAAWLGELDARAAERAPHHHLYVLIDGVFVPGLHRKLADERKIILFASLPACTEETADASPFLTPFDPGDAGLKTLLRRCDRWPMVSVIETPESLQQLGRRLAAWCVVEADGQRFNFRFPDTRRLPAIFAALNPAQRERFAGLATRLAYMARDGRWRDLPVQASAAEIAVDPILDAHQFADLVADSLPDELMVMLNDRGHEVYRSPSRSHALLSSALRAAKEAAIGDEDVSSWCEWVWLQDRLCEGAALPSMLAEWRATYDEDDNA